MTAASVVSPSGVINIKKILPLLLAIANRTQNNATILQLPSNKTEQNKTNDYRLFAVLPTGISILDKYLSLLYSKHQHLDGLAISNEVFYYVGYHSSPLVETEEMSMQHLNPLITSDSCGGSRLS